MTNQGTLMHTEEELDALLPGAVVADKEGDELLRVPGGWRYRSGVWASPSAPLWLTRTVLAWGSVVLVDPGPMEAHLADPDGQRLVQAILDRKEASQ